MTDHDQEERYAWKRDLNDRFTGKFDAEMIPVADALRDVGLGLRFFFTYYLFEKYWYKRVPTFDPFFHNISHPNQKGPPIGGIGCGVLTRSWQGDYTRSGIKAGLYYNALIPVNQFSLYTKRKNKEGSAMVLNSSKENNRDYLSSWNWWNTPGTAPKSHLETVNSTPTIYRDTKGTFECTYPRSWYTYEQPSNKLKLTCLQYSPVIAHNYKESSYPVGLFVWNIENLDDSPIEVSLMFTFQNGMGTSGDSDGGHYNKSFVDDKNDSAGVNMFHQLAYSSGEVRTGKVVDLLTYTIAARNDENSQITTVGSFDPTNSSHNTTLWNTFRSSGE
jgi:non-lysosomal glucosylceramidase